MAHSNLTTSKALRKANNFLLVLNGFLLASLVATLIITYYGLLPGFHSIQWFIDTGLYSQFFLSAVCGAIFIYAYIFCWQQNNGWTFFIAGYLLASLLLIIKVLHIIDIPNLANPAALIIWLCCIASLIKASIETANEKRATNLNLLLTITLPVLFIILSSFFLCLTIVFHPTTQDQLLMALDATLGIYPSFLAGQLFSYLPAPIYSLIAFIYLSLPCSLAIVYAGRYYEEKKPPLEFVIEFFLIGICGMLLYHINTGCGPINAFKTIWPQQLPIIPLHPQKLSCIGKFLPRNCLPSLHTAWAVCLWRHSLRCNPKVRLFVIFWVICTLMATLGLGEHYLVDLVVGFALATLIGGICALNLPFNQSARKNAILGGGLMCICWYIIINFGLSLLRISPLIAWFCYLGSIYLIGKLEFNLTRAQKLINSHDNLMWAKS